MADQNLTGIVTVEDQQKAALTRSKKLIVIPIDPHGKDIIPIEFGLLEELMVIARDGYRLHQRDGYSDEFIEGSRKVLEKADALILSFKTND